MELEREMETYHRLLPELLVNEGKFAVIYGDELIAVRETYEDALREGYRRFHRAPFMVTEITAEEPIHFIPGFVPCRT